MISYVLGGIEFVELFDRFAVEFAWKVTIVLWKRFPGLEARVRLRLVLVLLVVLGDFLLGEFSGGRSLLLTPPDRLLRVRRPCHMVQRHVVLWCAWYSGLCHVVTW